jgi:ribosomal protein L37AE/L43A
MTYNQNQQKSSIGFNQDNAEKCPKCRAPSIARESGCKMCYSCGWSACG